METFDFVVIGGGIIGLAMARELRRQLPEAGILLLEKENTVAAHASGRNSGVLHAGFYYSADSLKARFCAAGNKRLKEFCRERGLALMEGGKVVVARNEQEVPVLDELYNRGIRNGVQVELVSAAEAAELEPQARTVEKALYSPTTATVDPTEVCLALAGELEQQGVELARAEPYCGCKPAGSANGAAVLHTSSRTVEAGFVVNCAGLYADRVARDFGFGTAYTIVPFKGLYLKYRSPRPELRCHIYPVPNLKNPFVGVHFTKTVDGHVKIGPTAIPAFWREHYSKLSGFKLREAASILALEAKLFLRNSFGFRSLAFEELRKYARSHLIRLAQELAPGFPATGFGDFTRPGIRAQLVDLRTNALVSDFVLEGDRRSVHLLNAVSPAFTSSLPFAEYVVREKVLSA